MPMLVGEVRCATVELGHQLDVVGRQRVILGADERLEVAPGLARHRLEEVAVGGAELRRAASAPAG